MGISTISLTTTIVKTKRDSRHQEVSFSLAGIFARNDTIAPPRWTKMDGAKPAYDYDRKTAIPGKKNSITVSTFQIRLR